jgi:hypothetical protein
VLCNEVVRNKRPPSSSVAIIFVYMVSLVAWQQRARAIFLLPSANQTIQGTNGQNKQRELLIKIKKKEIKQLHVYRPSVLSNY